MNWHPTEKPEPGRLCPVRCEDGREGVVRVLDNGDRPPTPHGKVWERLQEPMGAKLPELLDGAPTFVEQPAGVAE